VFENGALRGTFGLERKGRNKGMEKQRVEELHNLCPSLGIIRLVK
jgi:hypothetical protein